MSHSLSDLLLRYAQQMEDQHAPQNMTIALREAAKELDRLYAGGCARDQGTTQYCAEAVAKDQEIARLRFALQRVRRHVTPMVKGYIDNVLRSSGGNPALADGEVGEVDTR